MHIKVFSDGSHNKGGLITKSAVVIYQDGIMIDTLIAVGGEGWSDIAEYNAVIIGLQRLLDLNLENESISWFNDSEFIMNQMAGRWRIKAHKAYGALALKAKELAKQFKHIEFNWIPREQNEEADSLSKL